MDTSEIEAALMAKLSSLHTEDPEETLEKMKSILGNDVTKESCKFFLDAANWDLAKALGTFYDCNLDPTALNRLLSRNFNVNTNEMEVALPNNSNVQVPDFLAYTASVIHNPNEVPDPSRTINICVKNNGIRPWELQCQLIPQTDAIKAPLITYYNNDCLWIPIKEPLSLPSLCVSETRNLVINLEQPSDYAIEFMKHNQKPVIGACSFCKPDGTTFGDTVYFTAIPEFNLNRIVYIAGCHTSYEQIPSTSNSFVTNPIDEEMC